MRSFLPIIKVTFVFLLVMTLKTGQAVAQDFNSKHLKKALLHYDSGAYLQAIASIKKFKSKKVSQRATRDYLIGLSYFKLQEYDLANQYFKKVVSAKYKIPALSYEYGQSLYAVNELEMARKQFNASIKANYQKNSSLYYKAYISSLLDQHQVAFNTYEVLLNSRDIDISLEQISRFNQEEAFIAINSEVDNIQDLIKKRSLPNLEKARRLDPHSVVAKDIRKRVKELKTRYDLDPLQMLNGRKLATQPYRVNFRHQIQNDTNVTLASDVNAQTATKEESLIREYNLFGKYRFIAKKQFTINPELRLIKQKYSNRESTAVISNDSLSIAPALRTTYEHRALKKMASFIFDIEHNITQRDRLSQENHIFFSRSTTFIFGERIRYYPFGDTTFKFKYRSLNSFNVLQDSNTVTFSLDQVAVLPNKHLMLALLQYESSSVTNDTFSTASLTTRIDYIMQDIFQDTELGLAFTFLALDTKAQSNTRGTEITLTPELRLTRHIGKRLEAAFLYQYQKKTSDSTAFAYQKHVTGLEVKVHF